MRLFLAISTIAVMGVALMPLEGHAFAPEYQVDATLSSTSPAASFTDALENSLTFEHVELAESSPSGRSALDPQALEERVSIPPTAVPMLQDAIGNLDLNVPTIRTAKVDRHVQFFSYQIRDRFEQWLSRFERYRPSVQNIFTEFKLPVDLVFLSLVESGFNTNAVSRAKAVGPWQFIKSTAKTYGLRVDKWIDERRDPVKSTLAAAQYLRDLYHLFGSWPLAMAAYNAGERRVGRALARAHADDFWDLTDTKLIRRETREYVPRFLAATLIAKDPSRYGFLINPQPPVEYEEAVITRPIHLRVAAKAAGVTYQELKALNPELRKEITPPDPAYRLKVPAGSKDLLLSNLATYPDWKHIQATRYRVRHGETLLHFTTRHHTPLSAILEANALDKSYKPKPGEWLLIPKPVKAKS